MSHKKTILILCDWFLPGYMAGGPIQSVATLTKQLGNDINFKIITSDRDFKSNTSYKNIEPNVWTTFEGRSVFYISEENMNADFILKLIQSTSHDTLYLNSLFSKWFTIYPLKWKQQHKIKSRIVLAPRGMLRDGALAVKPLKKKLFLVYARLTGLFKNAHWQSTCKQETSEIKQRIGCNINITEVCNLPTGTHLFKGIVKHKNILKLCFIARIVDIKNLNFAIDILKNITDYTIEYDIYGPKEDEDYWQLCQSNAANLPVNIKFAYKCVLQPHEIADTISNYHALFLPTQTENFGHIIIETLQSGRPVVISDQTPWRNLQLENAGFDIPLNNALQFADAIKQLAKLDQASFDTMSQNSLVYVNQKLNIEEIKATYLKLFN